ncbi:MAG: NTP transferase domain-containing protein [Bacteroidetes bacterium]|nr:NTP transferase domain-containing protein [Bacteroidota bacterium]MBL6943714.1 NTP transferase domain-containing protein [Bacteroidales bacterium]
MKAIILAAGLGTRLKKITDNKPKALIEINGKTMLETVIQNLKNQGVYNFLINIHHLGQSIIDYLTENNNFGVNISISDERQLLLDTGGAILNAQKFISGNEPILVHNVDIISNINIQNLVASHKNDNSIATLCVRKRNSQRALLFNNSMHLIGWCNLGTNEFRWSTTPHKEFEMYAFSGIYIIEPEFIDHITLKGKFSIIDAWLEIVKNNTYSPVRTGIISGYIDKSEIWHDLGTIEKINIAKQTSR